MKTGPESVPGIRYHIPLSVPTVLPTVDPINYRLDEILPALWAAVPRTQEATDHVRGANMSLREER